MGVVREVCEFRPPSPPAKYILYQSTAQKDEKSSNPAASMTCGMCNMLGMHWYEKGYFCFLDFLRNFPYKCLGMQSMRLPPQTRPWYEKGYFCFLHFLHDFP